MKTLTRGDLDADLTRSFSTQNYAGARKIDGVRIVEARRFTEDGGSFCELMRLADGQPAGFEGFRLAQVNYSELEPGTVKAWHLHFEQEDIWFVPPSSKLLVGLWDVRAASASRGVSMRLAMGDGKAQLLYIPRGVCHGAANVTSSRQLLMYFVNNTFDAADPDEHRLDPFALGEHFWTIQAG